MKRVHKFLLGAFASAALIAGMGLGSSPRYSQRDFDPDKLKLIEADGTRVATLRRDIVFLK